MSSLSNPAESELGPRSNRWTIAMCALIGLGLGLLAFAFTTPTYEAEVLVSVRNPAGTFDEEMELVTSETVIGASAAALGYTPDITVTAAEVSSLLTIVGRSDDPQRAAAAANAVANTYVQAQTNAAATIAQAASVPDSASGIGPLIYAAIGTLAGAIFGAGVSYLQVHRGARVEQELRSQQAESPAVSPMPAPVAASLSDQVSNLSSGGADPPAAPSFTSTPESPLPSSTSLSSATSTTSAAPTTSTDAAAAHGASVGPAIDPDQPAASEQPPTQSNDPDPDMTSSSKPSSFFDAAVSADAAAADLNQTALPDAPFGAAALSGPTGIFDVESTGALIPSDETRRELNEHDRRAMQSQYEAARYEMDLAHNQEIAKLAAEHERHLADLRTENARLNKQLRVQAVRIKNHSGTDQNRVGDLEAQVDALEIELADLRQHRESERIGHTQRITEERGNADRALDNARREFRDELGKHEHTHRAALAEHRADLDRTLSEDRTKHARALEAQHQEYETQLESERQRAEAKLASSTERHERELAELISVTEQKLNQQATQHKETIESLRDASDNSDTQARDLDKANRLLRAEIASLRSQLRHNETDHATTKQRLVDELAISKSELDGERERNAALRADVLRRSAEAHQVIDRAVEERTAQLAELEASVTRQREYADARVREMSTAAEERAREAATREANLTATVSRLKRELEELKKTQSITK